VLQVEPRIKSSTRRNRGERQAGSVTYEISLKENCASVTRDASGLTDLSNLGSASDQPDAGDNTQHAPELVSGHVLAHRHPRPLRRFISWPWRLTGDRV
jgi:hypothetical protein